MKSGFRNIVARHAVHHVLFDETTASVERVAEALSAADTINSDQFEEVEVEANRCGEQVEDNFRFYEIEERVSRCGDQHEEVDQQVLEEEMKKEILEVAGKVFKRNKVYANDRNTRRLVVNYLEGLENFLGQNKCTLQGDFLKQINLPNPRHPHFC